MALSIGVSVGSKIEVGGHIVRVVHMAKPNLIVVSVDDGPEFVVSDQARTEILPQVFVFTGQSLNKNQAAAGNRLAFEADKSIPIRRLEEKNAAK